MAEWLWSSWLAPVIVIWGAGIVLTSWAIWQASRGSTDADREMDKENGDDE